MINLFLFMEFFYISVCALGGGFAIIPFLDNLILRRGWITHQDLLNLIALAEITPGAIGVNMATYTGFFVSGIFGGIIATTGLILPSLIIISIVSYYLNKLKQNQIFISVFNAIKPSVVGLLASVCFSLFVMTMQEGNMELKIEKVILLCGLFYLSIRFKPRPVFYIIGMGIVGILLEL